MSFSTILALLVSVITASTAQIFLKKGVLNLTNLNLSFSGLLKLFVSIFQNKWLFLGSSLFVFSFVFYLFVLSKLQLNLAYPVMVSAGIILVAIGSWTFFQEQVSQWQVLGISLIILGIFLLFPKI
ncbi:MAG: SMR family transporter [Patescibacteria group bacterium]|nr:SMR family transporter [Patescibacteria group bacterium]